MTTYNLNPITAGLRYQARQSAQGGSIFVKNAVIAYLLDATSCTEITDIDYPSKHEYAVTSITRSGTTATVTTTATNSLETGDSVVIAGAVEADYNGTFTITVTSPTTFTYTVANSPTTPATGTITATGGFETVPGIVYLDDYFFVQKTNGDILHCDSGGAYTSWSALNFIAPTKEPSLAVYLGKVLNFVVSLKQWDTEFFYNATNPAPGSVLSTSEASYIKIGCATAESVVEFDGAMVFMSKRDQKQRSREIHMLDGMTPVKISTPEVERILNGDDLADVRALYIATAGHQFYVLTLVTTGITLVYDFGTKLWQTWTVYTAQAAQTFTAGSLTQSGGVATAVLTAHGFSDGDPITIAGASQAEYNGTFNITYVDANTFTFDVDSAAVSPATGTITATGYTEGYFPGVDYANYQNVDLILHETSGVIYSLDADTYQDAGLPINLVVRTPHWDAGNIKNKAVSDLTIISDLFDGNVLARWSDDDYTSWSKYRRIDKSVQDRTTRRLGATERRAYEIRHTENTAFRAEAIEQNASQGR